MSTSGGKIFARRVGDDVCFLIVGRVTAHHSPALWQYGEEGIAGGGKSIRIDLRDCTHCDSTFLGTLLQLKRLVEEKQPEGFRIVGASSAFRQVFAQIGAARLFTIDEQSPKVDMQATWEQLEEEGARADKFRFKKTVVEAHQALADEGGELASRFGSLAEAVRKELDAEQRQST